MSFEDQEPTRNIQLSEDSQLRKRKVEIGEHRENETSQPRERGGREEKDSVTEIEGERKGEDKPKEPVIDPTLIDLEAFQQLQMIGDPEFQKELVLQFFSQLDEHVPLLLDLL